MKIKLAHKGDFNFTEKGFFKFLGSFFAVSAVVIWCLIAYTPLRTFIPGYPDARSKRVAIQNAIKVDSLESVISCWEIYSENLKNVLLGAAPVSLDSVLALNAADITSETLNKKADSLLRLAVKNEQRFELGDERRSLPIEGLHFFTPLKGVVRQGFDNYLHPYMDITAPENSVVMATLDGTVIFSGWTDEFGYMLTIQHENDIVSVYKRNNKILKKSGDRVSAGTPVALVGHTGSHGQGDHLQFELWHKGVQIDPASYIKF